MQGNRLSRLTLKGKTRNNSLSLSKVRDKELSSEFAKTKGGIDLKEKEIPPLAKKMRLDAGIQSASNGLDSDDIVMISDDDENEINNEHKQVKTELKNHPQRSETVCQTSEDISLQQLRKQLLQIETADYNKTDLDDLPVFTSTLNGPTNTSRESTSDTLVSDDEVELSPLPQMCSWCRRRKPVYYNVDLTDCNDNNFHDKDSSNAMIVNEKHVQTCLNEQNTVSSNEHSELTSVKLAKTDSVTSAAIKPQAVNLFSKRSTLINNLQAKENKSVFSAVVQNSPHNSSSINQKRCDTKFPVNKNEVVKTKCTKNNNDIGKISNSAEERGDNLLLRLSKHEVGSSTSVQSLVRKDDTVLKGSNSPMPDEVTTKQSYVSSNNQSDEKRINSCPLCLMDFDSRMSSVDVDGHIAACLATADDDVVW